VAEKAPGKTRTCNLSRYNGNAAAEGIKVDCEGLPDSLRRLPSLKFPFSVKGFLSGTVLLSADKVPGPFVFRVRASTEGVTEQALFYICRASDVEPLDRGRVKNIDVVHCSALRCEPLIRDHGTGRFESCQDVRKGAPKRSALWFLAPRARLELATYPVTTGTLLPKALRLIARVSRILFEDFHPLSSRSL
jgi:hypothetical protein